MRKNKDATPAAACKHGCRRLHAAAAAENATLKLVFLENYNLESEIPFHLFHLTNLNLKYHFIFGEVRPRVFGAIEIQLAWNSLCAAHWLQHLLSKGKEKLQKWKRRKSEKSKEEKVALEELE